MKIQQHFTIDSQIVDKLKKESNMSELVNRLLYKHYEQNESVEEMEQRLKELEIMAEAQRKVEELRNAKRI